MRSPSSFIVAPEDPSAPRPSSERRGMKKAEPPEGGAWWRTSTPWPPCVVWALSGAASTDSRTASATASGRAWGVFFFLSASLVAVAAGVEVETVKRKRKVRGKENQRKGLRHAVRRRPPLSFFLIVALVFFFFHSFSVIFFFEKHKQALTLHLVRGKRVEETLELRGAAMRRGTGVAARRKLWCSFFIRLRALELVFSNHRHLHHRSAAALSLSLSLSLETA